jgi:hypothetical protein
MSKSEKIRVFVRENPGSTKDQISAGVKLDRQFVKTVCAQRVKAGEFVCDDEGGLSCNPDFVKGKHQHHQDDKVRGNREALRRQRKAKTAKQRKPRVTSMRELADRHAAPVITPVSHVLTTLSALTAVLDLEGSEPMIAAAFRSHCEAIALLDQGARA